MAADMRTAARAGDIGEIEPREKPLGPATPARGDADFAD